MYHGACTNSFNPQLFNYERLETSSISRVIETKTTYALYYGTASGMIRKEILLRKEMMLA